MVQVNRPHLISKTSQSGISKESQALLSAFAQEASRAPSYSSVYNVQRRTSPSSNLPRTGTYQQVYSNVGLGASREGIAKNLAETPAVSDIPFGFANALFENQLTPRSVQTIITKQSNPSGFLSKAFDFLQGRVTENQVSQIGKQIGFIDTSNIGPPNYSGSGGFGSIPPDSSGLINASGNFIQPSDLAKTSSQEQNATQQPNRGQQAQGGGSPGGSDSQQVGAQKAGLFSGIEDFIKKHPVATLIVAVVIILVLTAGSSEGRRRK